MGNDPSKKENHEVKHESPDMKINHEKFQHFKYFQAEDLIQITTQVENQKVVKAWDNDLKRLNAFQDKEALLLPNKHEFTPKGFCGNIGSVKIYYENYPYLFEEEIDNRISMNKHFQEEELWYLLYSLVGSARDFNSIDKKIGDVRPYNIFINEEGQIKIANIYSWPYEKTNFQKTAFQKQLTYLSPQEMQLVSKGHHQNTKNKTLSQSFSIGLTLLESGLLFNVRQLYSVQIFSFDLQKLNQKLNQWQNLQFLYENNTYVGYSYLLKEIVKKMCSPDQTTRLSSLIVQSILRPYQNQILNLKQFDHQHIRLPWQNQPLPVQTRPAEIEQIEYHSYNARPAQSNSPVLSIPQQTIKVNTYIEPKVNSKFNIQSTPIVEGNNIVRFGSEKVKFTTEPTPAQIHEQQFTKYAAFNHQQPTYQATQLEATSNYKTQVPNQYYQQKFHKYSNLNQSPPNTTSNNTASIAPGNNFSNLNTVNVTNNALNYQTASNVPILNFNQNTFNQPNFVSPTFTTSNYIPAGFNSQFSRPINVVQTTSQAIPQVSGINLPSNDNSSDFLKKIDEQLEHSRKQFPS